MHWVGSWHGKCGISLERLDEVYDVKASALLGEFQEGLDNAISSSLWNPYLFRLPKRGTKRRASTQWLLAKTCLNSLEIQPRLGFRLVNRCLSSGAWDTQELKKTRLQTEEQKSIQNCLPHFWLRKPWAMQKECSKNQKTTNGSENGKQFAFLEQHRCIGSRSLAIPQAPLLWRNCSSKEKSGDGSLRQGQDTGILQNTTRYLATKKRRAFIAYAGGDEHNYIHSAV